MKYKKECKLCGKEYYVYANQANRSKFCSDTCFRKSKNTLRQYKCDYCHKEFLVRESKLRDRINNSKPIYCSAQCARDVQKPKWEDIMKLFKDRDYTLISTEYTKAKSKLLYVCNKHIDKGTQSITYGNIRAGFGCKYCGDERTSASKRLSIEEVEDIFARQGLELVEGQSYSNTAQIMAYICPRHREVGVQYMTTSNAYKNGCPHCNASKGERKISNFLNNNNMSYQSQKKFETLRGIKGKPLSYDFFIPEFNLLIEYQGQFHDHTVSLQTEEMFNSQVEHDKRKRKYAKDNNIDLLEIWYTDLNNIEDILINALL